MRVYEVNRRNALFAAAFATAVGVIGYKALARKIQIPRIDISLPRERFILGVGVAAGSTALVAARRFLRTDLGFSDEDLRRWDARDNKRLLNICYVVVTDAGLAFLLRRYPEARRININADSQLSDRGLEALRGSNVRVIFTCDLGIARRLCLVVPKIITVATSLRFDLERCKPQTATPQELDISGAVRRFEDLAHVANTVLTEEERSQITKLNINNSKIGDDNLPEVMKWFPNVKTLLVSDTDVTLDGLKPHVGNLEMVGLSVAMIEAVGGSDRVRNRLQRSPEFSVNCWFSGQKSDLGVLRKRVVERVDRTLLDFSEMAAVAVREAAELVSAPDKVTGLNLIEANVTDADLFALFEKFTGLETVWIDTHFLTSELQLPDSVTTLVSPVQQVDEAGGWEALKGSCPALGECELEGVYPSPPKGGELEGGDGQQWLEKGVANRPDRTKLDLSGRILSLEDLRYIHDECLHDPSSITAVNLKGTGLTQADWDGLGAEE